jgi:hypothetical protein
MRCVLPLHCAALLGALAGSAHASVVYYVSTGIAGQLAPIDSANDQYWEFAVSSTINDFGGGNFTMKRANNNSTQDITFTLYQGTYANRLTSSVLMTKTLPASGAGAVSTSFANTVFGTGSAVTLSVGQTYTIVLSSLAATNASYAIKGGADTPLGWVDQNGNSVPDATVGAAVTTTSLVPGPGAAVTLAFAALAARGRRRP